MDTSDNANIDPRQRIANNGKCMPTMDQKHGLPIAEYHSGAIWQD